MPPGKVSTCGDLADALGNRIAARWVGHVALHHEHGENCPCHRVLRAGGALGGYVTGSTAKKAMRLRDEGVIVRKETVDLEQFGFNEFVSDWPLEHLRKIQEEVQSRIVVGGFQTVGQASSDTHSQMSTDRETRFGQSTAGKTSSGTPHAPRLINRVPKFVGAVDVAYPSPGVGSAAYALVETATGKLVWSTAVRREVTFPYISTYLSFREIPVLLDLIDAVQAAGRLAEVLLVDGSGILHHRHAGIASHFGVVAEIPTIGVTKKLLCGTVDIKQMQPGESRPVVHDDLLIGFALRPTASSLRPIFVSPGHRVDLAFSEQVVRALLFGRRLPEPLYWADRLSRK